MITMQIIAGTQMNKMRNTAPITPPMTPATEPEAPEVETVEIVNPEPM
jgi:hypothetical protein